MKKRQISKLSLNKIQITALNNTKNIIGGYKGKIGTFGVLNETTGDDESGVGTENTI